MELEFKQKEFLQKELMSTHQMTSTRVFPLKQKDSRFGGLTEKELEIRGLPDYLTTNLEIVIIGINPGLTAAYKGHHYAGPGNHFWKCLYLAQLIPHPMSAQDDSKLIDYGIGFTNMVARSTRSSSDLTRSEMKEGAFILQQKLQRFQPKIAVFNGKGINKSINT